MPNNSKLPLQTQPSTLDIVLRNGQMNLATAIGRLEQAVTKAYGNINSSINSKQGEFNQALLKTLDQSISKSSNKMDQFYTSSFAKIYALNSAIMEQSLQKSGMAAAQKDLEGYRNLDKIFESQQRAFSDINFSLQRIVEKVAPLSDEQRRVRIHNYTQSRDVKYNAVSTFAQITDRHDVGLEETLKNFDHFNDSFKNRKNANFLKKDPIIAALVENNQGLLKELQETSDITKFIVLLIKSLSKAKKDKNESVMQQARKNLSPGMLSVMTDGNINFIPPDQLEGKTEEEKQKIYNQNVLSRIMKRANKEEQLDAIIESNKLSYTAAEVKQTKYTNDMVAQTAVSLEKYDPDNKKYIADNIKNPNAKIVERIKEILGKDFDSSKYNQPLIAKILDFGTTLVPSVNLGVTTIDLKGAEGLANKWDRESDKESTVNTQASKIRDSRLPQLKSDQSYSGNALWLEYTASGRNIPKGFTPAQIMENLFSIPKETGQVIRSITGTISKNENKVTQSDYIKNMQLNKQIISTPNVMQQKLNIHIALTQNGLTKSEYSLEKNVTLPQKGNGSVVMIDNFATQMALGTNGFNKK